MAFDRDFAPVTALALLEAMECGRSSCTCHQSARRGKGLTHCPAHGDSSPSFSVKPGDDGGALWHCFGGCPKEETTRALGDRGLLGKRGMRAGPPPRPLRRGPVSSVVETVPERQAALIAWAMEEYRKMLPNSPGLIYMRKRSLPEAGAGWAPGGSFLLGRVGPDGERVSLEELVDAGLVRPEGKYPGSDVMQKRIVFAFSWRSRMSALCGRTTRPNFEPRYLYTSSKGRWPLGIFNEQVGFEPYFAVTEGALDAIALTHLCGAPAMALGGLTQPVSIARLAALPKEKRVILAFDNDDAGDRGRAEIGKALANGPVVKYVRPGGSAKDWAEIVEARAALQRKGLKPPIFKLAEYEVPPPPLAEGAEPPQPEPPRSAGQLARSLRSRPHNVAPMSLKVR